MAGGSSQMKLLRNGRTAKAIAGSPNYSYMWLGYIHNVYEFEIHICSLSNTNLSYEGLGNLSSWKHLLSGLAGCRASLLLPEHRLRWLLQAINFWISQQFYTVFQTIAESFWVMFFLIYAVDCGHASSSLWHIGKNAALSIAKSFSTFICCCFFTQYLTMPENGSDFRRNLKKEKTLFSYCNMTFDMLVWWEPFGKLLFQVQNSYLVSTIKR